MRDSDLRSALLRRLSSRHSHDPHTLILEELGLRHGAARIDIAVINGTLHGYELKSDSDSLGRLARQAEIYNSVLDRVTLVVGPRHVEKAVDMVPGWWGVQLAEMGPRRGVQFCSLRRACNNPSLEALAVVKLLWRDEALSALCELSAAEGFHSKRRAMIYARLAEVAGLEMVRSMVRHQLRNRRGWRSGAP